MKRLRLEEVAPEVSEVVWEIEDQYWAFRYYRWWPNHRQQSFPWIAYKQLIREPFAGKDYASRRWNSDQDVLRRRMLMGRSEESEEYIETCWQQLIDNPLPWIMREVL
jgi:hypothetical protein